MAGEIIFGFTVITLLHKGGVKMVKRFLVFTLLVVFLAAPMLHAADWSDYESGRNNINLQGYQGQTGYIRFEDGNGNTTGYFWIGADGLPRYCSKDAIDLTTTKLTDAIGVIIDPLD